MKCSIRQSSSLPTLNVEEFAPCPSKPCYTGEGQCDTMSLSTRVWANHARRWHPVWVVCLVGERHFVTDLSQLHRSVGSIAVGKWLPQLGLGHPCESCSWRLAERIKIDRGDHSSAHDMNTHLESIHHRYAPKWRREVHLLKIISESEQKWCSIEAKQRAARCVRSLATVPSGNVCGTTRLPCT